MLELRGNTTTRRHKPGIYGGENVTPVAARARAMQPAGKPAPKTHQDDQLLDSLADTRTRTRQRRPDHTEQLRTPQQPQRERRGVHPLVWVGLTLIVIVLGWIATTSGASLWVTHFSDPGTYGPVHGTVITGVFGGGDSQAKTSKLIGFNNGGQIEVIKLTANDYRHMQVIPGPNLQAANFPDPTGAEVGLEVGDFNHDGYQVVTVTIYSTSFDYPIHRYGQGYTLYGDGKGNLKPQAAGGAQ